jgi:hypothetical protein
MAQQHSNDGADQPSEAARQSGDAAIGADESVGIAARISARMVGSVPCLDLGFPVQGSPDSSSARQSSAALPNLGESES